MKILKNAVISAVIGHAFGVAACLVGAIFALKMPNSDTSSAIFGVLSCTVGAVAVAVASKIQGHGSVICAVYGNRLSRAALIFSPCKIFHPVEAVYLEKCNDAFEYLIAFKAGEHHPRRRAYV